MNIGYIDLTIFMVVLTLLAIPLGRYITGVFTGSTNFLGVIERPLYKLIGANNEMSWKEYVVGIMLFNLFGILLIFILQLIQGFLPLNPEHLGAPSWDLALNTAVSFATNTNWQAYTPETTMSYLTQMLSLAVQNFLSAATALAVLVVLIRGFIGVEQKILGNVWRDLVRVTLYILLPLGLIVALVLVTLGVPQNFNSYQVAKLLEPQTVSQTVNGKTTAKIITTQKLPMGPIASQEAIKMVGTNGGGFLNANSAHPYENPNIFSNFLEMLAILIIPGALCFTFGKMVGDRRQGYTLYAAMSLIFIVFAICAMWAELKGNPLLKQLPVDQYMNTFQSGGNMEGKEVRFGIFGSGLFAAVTTAASCGAVNAMHDSLMPMGGFVPLFLMQLSEVIFGGVGSGLYGMLVFAILAVFIAGLMIGRTPEYLGKKIESFEMKMVAIVILIVPLVVLVGTAISVVTASGLQGMSNPGSHGFSEVLYAFTSGANNNGSAFAGLNANTPYYNLMIAAVMFIGRYGVIIPVLAIAGSLAAKKRLKVTTGTMPTHGLLFIGILIGVVLIVGALTYIPALALGPIVEHLTLYGT
ncbi:MAG TPA: potassium-transporting ATPase subunit KdpA [Aquella sp.]|nr:potassium-transporting ATPase subunit KdpA [Aquella sp.]